DALLVADERLQRVLEAAFVAEREVRVEVLDKQIQSVTIAQSPTTGCTDDGCVTELTCSPSCIATIAGRAKPVKSDDPRAIGVLLTAISDDRPVQQLDVDENDVIQRVKVNNSPPQV
ncbi:MAG TPA: hypothetical protein VHK90_13160, partial [Thermoanaerobaculia bacterium]|nr:hypothetical protein [Thermoanaerobaculia bacterium]